MPYSLNENFRRYSLFSWLDKRLRYFGRKFPRLLFCVEKIFSECSPRKWVKSFLWIFFTVFTLWGVLIFWLDPYICFHRAWIVKQTYSDSYATIPGMLRHFSYDSVLIGSSMCRDFRISEINTLLHVSAVKATAAGMTGDDAGRIIRLLTTEKRGSLKHVILGYDTWSFSKGGTSGHWRARQYLYDRRISWEYFFSMDSLGAACNVIVTNCAPAHTKGANLEKDFDRMFGNKVWRFTYAKDRMEQTILSDTAKPEAPRPDTMELTEKFVILPLGACPEIEADIFLPPYSIYFWTALADRGHLEDYLKIRRELAAKAAMYPNLRIHDFQAEEKIICNLDNYKDMNHYSPKVNFLILEGIRDRTHLTDQQTMEKNNSHIRKIVREWSPCYHDLFSGGEAHSGGRK